MQLHNLWLLALALSPSCLASQDKHACLKTNEAETLVGNFAKVMEKGTGYEALATKTFVKDFVAISDSYAYVFQNQLNTTNLIGRQKYLDAHENPEITYATHFISHTCDTITWYSTYLIQGIPVRRIHIMFVDLETKRFTKVYNEQNSGAMLYAMGLPECERKKRDWGVKVGREGVKKSKANCEGRG